MLYTFTMTALRPAYFPASTRTTFPAFKNLTILTATHNYNLLFKGL